MRNGENLKLKEWGNNQTTLIERSLKCRTQAMVLKTASKKRYTVMAQLKTEGFLS